MSDTKAQEPSMEEILASIRRIIAEDEPGGAGGGMPSEPASRSADILELTEAVSEDGSIRHLDGPGAPAVRSPPPTPPPIMPPPVEAPPRRPVDAFRSEAEPTPLDARIRDDVGDAGADREPRLGDRIVSSAVSGAAAAAFARLATMPRERRRELDLTLGSGNKTLEEIVRDVLRPLLQEWLDANLPEMVERLVREEIGRVVGEAGLR